MRRTDPNVVPLPSSADSLPSKVFEIEDQVRHTENAITVQVLAPSRACNSGKTNFNMKAGK